MTASMNNSSSSSGRTSPRRVSSKILQGTQWLSSIFSKPTSNPSTVTTATKRSSQLIAERMRWLEKQDVEYRQQSNNPSIDISSDLVAERMKLLEQSLTPTEGSKERASSVVEISNALVAERMRLLEESKLQGQERRQSRSVVVSPDLVSERMRWLEDRQSLLGQDGQTSTSSLRAYEAATSDLVAERLRLLSEQHDKSNNKHNEKEKVRPGKIDTSRRAPSFTNGRQSPPSSKPEDITAFGSLAEKRAFFLAEKQPTATPRNSGRIQRWGEHYMFYVDQMESNLAVELEQEGLIPNFLADWIFGSSHRVKKDDDNSASKDDESSPKKSTTKPSLMELLSLDYQPKSVDEIQDDKRRDDSTQSTQSLSPQADRGIDEPESFETESNVSRGIVAGDTSKDSEEKEAENEMPSVEESQDELESPPLKTIQTRTERTDAAVVNDDQALLLENLDGLVEPFPKTKLDDCCAVCQIL